MSIRGFLKYHIKDWFTLGAKWVQLKTWNSEPILVFTMAKVGSLSIYFSLRKSIPKTSIFHIHHLDLLQVQTEKKLCNDHQVYPGSRSPVPLILSEIVQKKRPYKVISLFRDPVERNISAFFEAFEMYVGQLPQHYSGSIQELEKLYHQKLPHMYSIHWFDQYFLPSTGIDVYSKPFNHQLGHTVFTQENISVLVMNSSIDDSIKTSQIASFTNANNITISNRNITANSKGAQLYQEFKNTVRFDPDYLTPLYTSKYATHFFSEAQIKAAIKKWSK